jgi:L-amino acid N-acyltransferase YncA
MIRIARLEDLSQIVAIYNQTIPLGYVTADTEMQTLESRIEWFHSFNKTRPLWVYEVNKSIVAWCSIKSFYGRPAYSITVEIGIYIDENLRNSGIGSALLLHAVHEAKALNIQTILAFIFAHNSNSIYFFKKYGFVEYGLLPSVAIINNEKIDLAILGYKIK